MTTLTERLQILITADAKGAAREFDKIGAAADKSLGKADDRVQKLSAGLTSFGTQAVLAAGVAGAGLFKVAESASAYGEQVSRATKTFGDEAVPVLEEFAAAAADTAGISKTAALQGASTFAAFAKQAGLSGQAAADMSTGLVQLAGDFASFVDIAPEEALTVFTSALSGEQEAIKRYGIDMSAAAVEQEALATGIKKGTGELTTQEKVLARQSILMREGALFAGDFADTSDSLANRQRALAAEFENAKIALGEGLLPLAESTVGAIQGLGNAFGSLSPEMQSTVGKFAGIGVAAAGTVGALSLVAGQALKMREAFTTLGADGTRSLNNLGKAARGLSIALAAIAVTDITFDFINDGAGYAAKAEKAVNDLKVALAEGSDQDAFAAFAGAVAAEQNTLRIQNLWQEFGAEIDLVGTGVKADVEQVQRAFDSLDPKDAEGALRLLEEATSELDPNSRQYQINTEFIDRNRSALSSASRAAKVAGDEASGAADGMDELGGSAGGAAGDVEDAGDALKDMLSPFTDAIDAARDYDKAIRDLSSAQQNLEDVRSQRLSAEDEADGLRSIEDAARGVADAYRSWEDAQRGVEDARVDLQRATEDLQEELGDLQGVTPGTVEYDEGLDRVKDLRRGQEDAVRGVEDAQRREQDAQREIAEAKQSHGDAQRDLTQARLDAIPTSDELRDAEEAVADANGAVIDATIENAGAQDILTQGLLDGSSSADEAKEALLALAEDAPPEVQKALADMANAMGLFAYVAVSNAEKVKNAWRFENLFTDNPFIGGGKGLTQDEKDIPAFARSGGGSRNAGARRDQAIDDFMHGRISGGRATGGPVAEDQTYQVNERGPELFSPRTSGFVMNASDTNRLLSGLDRLVSGGVPSQSGTTIERGAITVVAPSPQEAATATVRKMRSAEFLRGGGR